MKTPILLVITALFITACSSTSDTTKSEKQPFDFEELATNIENGNYAFILRSATPSGGRSITITSSYGLRVKDGVYEGHMPYFGRSYSGGYGQGGSIEFNGEPNDLEIKRKEGKDKITVRFNIRASGEKYDVKLEVGGSGYGNMIVSSSRRQTISYYGTAGLLQTN